MYVKCNIETRSRYHCCRGKSNKYHIFWVCVCSLTYPPCEAGAPHYTAICGLSGCTVFFQVIS